MKIWFCLFVHLLHFAYAYPIAPAQFVEKIIIFPIKSYWHVYQKLITIYVWIYFWTLLYCLSISMDVLYCLDYYCTVSWNLLIFFLYFKCALAILGPVHIHIHFKITSFSTRTLRKYNWDCIESIGQLVDNYNLFIIYEQGIFLYSLRFFFLAAPTVCGSSPDATQATAVKTLILNPLLAQENFSFRIIKFIFAMHRFCSVHP